MRRYIFILVITVIAFACQGSQDPTDEFPQTWKIAGWQIMGDAGDSGFQSVTDSSYTYLFKKDGSFLKTVGNESTIGSFEKEELIYEVGGKKTNYKLFFPENKLVNSCSTNLEYMTINENGMLVGGSAPCDGPAIYLTLVE
ncbi:hypothetical protein SAMN04489724_3794 [Algoriphagus locisalis]|uniref:Lipocalin-like domain-containing protein n=1 Tax=Algoriphagus locisalis TaxID=305507 RepID=A0A1I7D9H3_9BACT|nr:hypothetical protein [Algoriphagus locisalis]SFU08280.1 hypothetical protein SAMN04489724_3794 [Algoriphagus locisalis]